MKRLHTRVLVTFATVGLVASAFMVPQQSSADTVDRSTRFGTEAQTFQEVVPMNGPIAADLDKPVRVVVKLADKPVGEWNHFRIVMKGDKVNVWLNDVLVVENTVLEGYWGRKKVPSSAWASRTS